MVVCVITCLFNTRCFPFQYLSIWRDCRVLTISTGFTAVSWLISAKHRTKRTTLVRWVLAHLFWWIQYFVQSKHWGSCNIDTYSERQMNIFSTLLGCLKSQRQQSYYVIAERHRGRQPETELRRVIYFVRYSTDENSSAFAWVDEDFNKCSTTVASLHSVDLKPLQTLFFFFFFFRLPITGSHQVQISASSNVNVRNKKSIEKKVNACSPRIKLLSHQTLILSLNTATR